MGTDDNATLHVDLHAIEQNVAILRRVASLNSGRPVGICAVLKADAYGLGAARVAKRLEIAAVDMIAVYTAQQARDLVQAAVSLPILILTPVRSLSRTDPLYRALIQGRLHLALHDEDQLKRLAEAADAFGTRIPLHLELDVGLSRGGAQLEEAERLLGRVAAHKRLSLAGVYGHFSSAGADEEATALERARFQGFLDANHDRIPEACSVHLASTFAAFSSRADHHDMLRVGLALLGFASEDITIAAQEDLAELAGSLRPAVRLTSRIVHLTEIPKGARVGYGGTWQAERDSTIGLVPVGYADGYPRALSNGAVVRIEGDGASHFAPVVGRVSMDQLTIDLTDLPKGLRELGIEVELIGADPEAPNHLPALAQAAGTITHEMLTRLSPRLPRRYQAVDPAEKPMVVTRA